MRKNNIFEVIQNFLEWDEDISQDILNDFLETKSIYETIESWSISSPHDFNMWKELEEDYCSMIKDWSKNYIPEMKEIILKNDKKFSKKLLDLFEK
jgi:hypothetical protein